MTNVLEYHQTVRRSIPASVAVLGLFLAMILVSSGHAQINGVPASVTSPGFGGRDINGTPASVTSLGPRGFARGPNNGAQFFAPFPNFPRHDRGGERHRHFHNFIPFYGGYYPVVVPYPVEVTNDSEEDSDDYQGGPTIFDRRGRGAATYIPPVPDVPPARQPQATASSSPAAEPPQEPTVLVFKDGSQRQVGNYAIVGQTLYDLTPGRPHKIAVADLDLEATQKQNDERGVVFQLPPGSQAD